MSNPLFTAWHPIQATEAAPDPLAAIEQAVECLASNRPVPEPAASLLHSALLRFMAGTRLEQALGLCGMPGKPAPVQSYSIRLRDEKIRTMADLLSGCRHDKALLILELLHTDKKLTDSKCSIDLLVEDLKQRAIHGLPIPRSSRHVERILAGK